MEELFDRLSAPFPPETISWRIGSSNKKSRQRETKDQNAKATKGQALAYIDARDVMDRLDDVVGPGNWQDRYPHANGKTVCEIDIWIEGRGWVTKSDGAGDTDFEAEKGAMSDAFKRAAVRWGIGRYLYHIPAPWVALDDREQILDSEQKKLDELLERYTTQFEWGSPEARANLKALSMSIRSLVHTADDVRRYRQECAGVLSQLRRKAKDHIEGLLDQIADGSAAVVETRKVA